MLKIILAALHLLALGIGLGAVLTRGSVLRTKIDTTIIKLAIRYNTVWGIAALLWISTGLWRLFGQTEKSMSYYMDNHLFLTKMALLVLILILEARPGMTIGRWRKKLAAGGSVEDVVSPNDARMIAKISHVQAMLIVMMVVLAAGIARGIG